MYLLKQFTKYDCMRKKLTLNLFEEYGELQAGLHEFAWSFVVPANTAPYERWASPPSSPETAPLTFRTGLTTVERTIASRRRLSDAASSVPTW